MADLTDKHVAMIVEDDFEQAEFTGPKEILEKAGATVDVISPVSGPLQGLNHIDKADTFERDKALEDTDFDQYDAIVLPGGAINADALRMNRQAQNVVTEFFEEGKPVAAICHAPWLLASAGLIKGKKLTSYETIQDDIRNAGGTWVDQEVVVDGNLITSRKPDDVPAFSNALIGALSAA